MKNSTKKALAKDIYDFCKRNELWYDVCIFFGGDAWTCWSEWAGENGEKIGGDLFLYEDKDPRKFTSCANPMTLSMTFDGSDLYTVLNDWGYTFPNMYEEFQKIFEKHGCWYEMCTSWALTVCED